MISLGIRQQLEKKKGLSCTNEASVGKGSGWLRLLLTLSTTPLHILNYKLQHDFSLSPLYSLDLVDAKKFPSLVASSGR